MFDRHPNASDAASNLAALCNVLQGALTRRVTLFATLSQPGLNVEYSEGDQPYLPLIVAVVRHECAGHEMDAVFDGSFLTGADSAEIAELLDVAVSTGIAWFSTAPVPLTSKLSPEEAIKTLYGSMHASPIQLTEATRECFVRLLRGNS